MNLRGLLVEAVPKDGNCPSMAIITKGRAGNGFGGRGLGRGTPTRDPVDLRVCMNDMQ